ncbi:FtsX-like permease family protein [Rhodococcus sp. G-MC3]|uniref:ABC transporter permease n=1 Tax=Rhodococcus sp. G-MC3 TaxID=3046209 RepID=UPI0024BAB484|nr:ABC transporter permease [Rhodococcus sp. G-MC3]MDJ0394023.1 FtsX-like permease family protein [Rhodococcus sp. G-MC3]
MRALAHSRDHATSLLVTALASAFGVSLIQATSMLSDVVGSQGGTAGTALFSVAAVFIGLSMYVASIVTANTFATVVAGRTATIALLRLIGAGAGALRSSVAREGLLVGLVGAALGLVIGVAGSSAARSFAVSRGKMPDIDYTTVHPLVLLPAVMVVLTTWIAARVGSRRVLAVTPIQATGHIVETPDVAARRPVRTALSIIAVGGGFVVLGLGVLLGLMTPTGVIVAFFGGLISFTGIVLGATSIMPATLSGVGKLFGNSASARLAAANAVRYPQRSTRTTIGLVIGVTLVVTLAVASASYATIMRSQPGSEDIEQALNVTTAILGGLVGFSAVIAAVGMVSNMTLSVLQRTRELVLLRALGFTRKQLRATIFYESAQMVIASVGLGVVLGVIYGWAAAQSLLGSIGDTGLTAPTLPWGLVAGTVLAAGILALVASLTPARRAGRLSPAAA